MGDATLTAANDDGTTLAANGAASAPKTVVFSMPEQVMPNMWLTDYDSLFYKTATGNRPSIGNCWLT